MVKTHSGSSPLARGTLKPDLDKLTRAGLIPARAGNTKYSRPDSPARRAHPRSRGEHHQPVNVATRQVGSSPLTRGTRSSLVTAAQHTGLIPAHAGNTLRNLEEAVFGWAHPRSRGEHGVTVHANPCKWGSSPLTRGTRRVRLSWVSGEGLIPAHAGNTRAARVFMASRRAHPRSRGEHTLTSKPTENWMGSSPLTRGTRDDLLTNVTAHGLIPAHAGNTGSTSRGLPWWRAHPRSRGEHARGLKGGLGGWGSSPLTRGTRT